MNSAHIASKIETHPAPLLTESPDKKEDGSRMVVVHEDSRNPNGNQIGRFQS